MANGTGRDGNDEKKRKKDPTGGKDESVHSEATPEADRDRDTAYDSSTSGGGDGETEDLSEAPPPAQRGRDLDH